MVLNYSTFTQVDLTKSDFALQNSLNFPGEGFFVSALDIDENGTQNAEVR